MANLTLAQHAQLTKQPLVKGVMQGILQEGVVADILRWRSTGGRLTETGVRFDEVITPDWIALGGSITSKAANAKPLSYGVFQMALHIDVPVNLSEANADQLEKDFVAQVRQATKGAAYQLNKCFVNGDQGSEPNQFDGINRLVAQMDSGQRVGSTEIDLTGTYTDALAEQLFSRIEDGIWACEGHKPTCAFANDTLLKKIESFARQYRMKGDDFNWMSSPYEINDPRRTLTSKSSSPAFTYRGIPFYDIGFDSDMSTRLIGNTYTEGGSTAAATRLFFVKEGEDQLEGLQLKPLEVVDIGLLEGTDVYRKRIKWTVGLAAWGPRCIVKVQGIKATA